MAKLDIGKVLFGAARGYAALDSAAEQTRARVHAVVGGVLSEAMHPEEQTALSALLYDRSVRAEETRRGLYPWERVWYGRALPPAPAHILVGACGAGRESVALVDQGYSVDAFDPAPRAVAFAERALQGRARLTVGAYRDLCDALAAPTGSGSKASSLAFVREQTYDAVILGWGSVSHLIGDSERREVFAAADQLAPRGPILASFYLKGSSPRTGRALQLGHQLGRVIRGWREQGRAPTLENRLELTYWGGFVRPFTMPEIDAIGASLGRRVDWSVTDGMPHVTLHKIS